MAGQKFCGYCGSRLARYCPECGSEITGNFAFCPNCGTPLNGGSAPQRGGGSAPSNGGNFFGNAGSFFDNPAAAFGGVPQADFGQDNGFGAPEEETFASAEERMEKLEREKREKELLGDFDYRTDAKGRISLLKYTNPIDTDVTIPSEAYVIGDGCFEGSGITSVTFNSKIVRIGRRAFARCKHLQTLELPATVSRIDDEAFMDCPNLDFPYGCHAEMMGENVFTNTKYVYRVAHEFEDAKKTFRADLLKTVKPERFRPSERKQIEAEASRLAMPASDCPDMKSVRALFEKSRTALIAFADKLWTDDEYNHFEAMQASMIDMLRKSVDVSLYSSAYALKINTLMDDYIRKIKALSANDLPAKGAEYRKEFLTAIKPFPTADDLNRADAARKAVAKRMMSYGTENYTDETYLSLVLPIIKTFQGKLNAIAAESEIRRSEDSLVKAFVAELANRKIETKAEYEFRVAAKRKADAEAKALHDACSEAFAHLDSLAPRSNYESKEAMQVTEIKGRLQSELAKCKNPAEVKSILPTLENRLLAEIAPIKTAAILDAERRKKKAEQDAYKAALQRAIDELSLVTPLIQYRTAEKDKINKVVQEARIALGQCSTIAEIEKKLPVLKALIKDKTADLKLASEYAEEERLAKIAADKLAARKKEAENQLKTLYPVSGTYRSAEEKAIQAEFSSAFANLSAKKSIAEVDQYVTLASTSLKTFMAKKKTAAAYEAEEREAVARAAKAFAEYREKTKTKLTPSLSSFGPEEKKTAEATLSYYRGQLTYAKSASDCDKLFVDAVAKIRRDLLGADLGDFTLSAYDSSDAREMQDAINRYHSLANSAQTFAELNDVAKNLLVTRKLLSGYKTKKQKADELDRTIDATYEKATAGDSEAMYRLGLYYQTGRGVTRSYVDAFLWFEKAAKKGHKKAMEATGDCYMEGRGVKQNYKEAEKWYNKASK